MAAFLRQLSIAQFQKEFLCPANYDFEKKKTKYFASGDTSPFTLTNEVRNYTTWKPSDIEARREILLQRLVEDWQLRGDFEKWWEAR